MQAKIEELLKKKEEAKLGGGKERIKNQHDKGKLTARERIELLVDEGSFEEVDMFVKHRSTDFGLEKQKYLGDGVVTGTAKIDGRPVALYSQDFTVFGGSLSESHAEKIIKVLKLAMKTGAKMPRHGLIANHPLIMQAEQKMHGKTARALADKISIAAKVDYFMGKFVGDELKKGLIEKFGVEY